MELQILNYIQTIRTPVLDAVMSVITSLGNAGILWIILAFLLLIFRKTRKIGLIVAAALIFDLIICNFIIKPLVARVRPFDVNTAVQLLVSKPKDYSFPSGHTAAAFATTAALFFAGEKRMGAVACLLSCLIALSRLYLYVHYPTDVLGGVIIGCLCGWLGYKAVMFAEKKIEK